MRNISKSDSVQWKGVPNGIHNRLHNDWIIKPAEDIDTIRADAFEYKSVYLWRGYLNN